jgi:hypothetical protein
MDECSYLIIGPIFSERPCEGVVFDDFETIEVCCDVHLDNVTIYFNGFAYISGIGASYTLDYGTRH